MKPCLPLLAALLGLSQCHKNNATPADPAGQLPPATQTGANTFGCLVNGKAWTPQGFDGTVNFSVVYDPTYRQGTLNVAAYRYENGAKTRQSMGVFSDSLQRIGLYKLRTLGHHGAAFSDASGLCYYTSTDAKNYCRGQMTITRLDQAAGIFSGTFSFTMATPGCDTLKVTQGRFDYKR